MASEYASQSLSAMKEADVEDRARERERLRERRPTRRENLKLVENGDDEDESAPRLASDSE